jgi:hypothetical protein
MRIDMQQQRLIRRERRFDRERATSVRRPRARAAHTEVGFLRGRAGHVQGQFLQPGIHDRQHPQAPRPLAIARAQHDPHRFVGRSELAEARRIERLQGRIVDAHVGRGFLWRREPPATVERHVAGPRLRRQQGQQQESETREAISEVNAWIDRHYCNQLDGKARYRGCLAASVPAT